MTKRLTPSDAMFLYGESRETMMHVAGLLQFSPPPDADPDHLRHLMDEVRERPPVHRPWNMRLRTPDLLANPLQSWMEVEDVDVEYHVRRTALPSPGDARGWDEALPVTGRTYVVQPSSVVVLGTAA